MRTQKVCLLVALALSVPAHAAFRCVDEKGRTHVGDTPPPGCGNVVMYEVTRGGTVIRTIQPTMSDEQVKAKQEAEEKARAAEKAASEQKRKDSALLASYANEREFDVARDRNIDPLRARITQSEQRAKEIDKRVKVVKEEMEFYTAGKKKSASGKDAAAPMAAELERLNEEKKQINKNVDGYNREIADIRNKFDVDKRRWLALKQGTANKPAEPPAEAKAEPVKADAKAAKK
jgi:chromosome segregation ATPase